MPHPLELEIRSRLSDYLSGRLDLDDFEDWFVVAGWNVHQLRDQSLEDLVYGVDLLLIEHGNGDWNEDQLRQKLRPFVEMLFLDPAPECHSLETAGSGHGVFIEIPQRPLPAGLQLVRVTASGSG